jgi:hypothetical protein
MSKRCEECNRRLSRPGHPLCSKRGLHRQPTLAEKVVAAIEDDLTDRRGLRQEWESIDDDTQDDIRKAWARIVVGVLRKNKEQS